MSFGKKRPAPRQAVDRLARVVAVPALSPREADVLISQEAFSMALFWNKQTVSWIPEAIVERTEALATEIVASADPEDLAWWPSRPFARMLQPTRAEAHAALVGRIQIATREYRNLMRAGAPSTPSPLDPERRTALRATATTEGWSAETPIVIHKSGICGNCGATGQNYRICSRCRRVCR
jgi:hypothetical protein